MLIVDPEIMRSFLHLETPAFEFLWRDTLIGGPIRKLMIEFHQRHISPQAVKRIIDAVSAAGFTYDPSVSQGQIVLLRRLP